MPVSAPLADSRPPEKAAATSGAAPEGARARSIASERRLADAVRALTIDAVNGREAELARIPLGMVDAATVLWRRFLKFDAQDPNWPDRDRFVLAAGRGAMLLYALLHLTGHAATRLDPAIETTGPLGQGFANAVGMALAERLLAARFGRSLVDHRTWVIASSAAFTEGVSHEAAAIAGRLRLARLTVLYHERSPSDEGGAAYLDPSGDPLKRFASLGWATKRVDGYDHAEVAGALSFALRSPRPTLIACRTPALAGGAVFGWTAAPCTIPDEIARLWKETGARGAHARRAWLRRLTHHALREEFERIIEGRLPSGLPGVLATLKAEFVTTRARLATHYASKKILEVLAPMMREMVGGVAGAVGAPAAPDALPSSGDDTSGFARRSIPYGAREHGMAGAMHGLARHGGIVSYGRAFLASSDYMRATLRLAALTRARVIYVFVEDSPGAGDDGPAPRSIDQLASLRAIPNFFLFRPSGPVETAECWELALTRRDGPSALVVTRKELPTLRANADVNLCARGGYVVAEATGSAPVTLIASGAEVWVALAARDALAASAIDARVVSLPCWELFEHQAHDYRAAVLGSGLRVGIEAAGGFGWERWLGSDGIFLGVQGFGQPGMKGTLPEHFGITPEAVAAAVKQRIE